jgi:hypothetical protein
VGIRLSRGVVPGVAEGYCVMLGSHLFGLLKVSQAHLELAASAGSVRVVAPVYHGMEKFPTG